MASRAARASASYMALQAAHDLMDHWGQPDGWATDKGKLGAIGIRVCALHCATYTAGQAVALAATSRALGLRINPRRALAALALSGITHYVADRQGGHWADEKPRGIVKLAANTGSAGWLQRDPQAGYLLDQSWHHFWIAAAAIIAAR